MPVVPVYRRQVSPTALPGVRKTAHETPESLGAGVELQKARTAETVAGIAQGLAQQTVGVAAQIAERERTSANKTTVLSFTNALKSKKAALLQGTTAQPGALHLSGKDAQAAPEKALADFDKAVAELGKTVMTPEAKAEFARISSSERIELEIALHGHAIEQGKKLQAEELVAFRQATIRDVGINAGNRLRVNQLVSEGEKQIRETLALQGHGAKTIQNEVDKFVSESIVTTIDSLVAQKKLADAKWWLKEFGPREVKRDGVTETVSQIDTKELERLTEKVEEGDIEVQTQEAIDHIQTMSGTRAEIDRYIQKTYKGKLEVAVRNAFIFENNRTDSIQRDDMDARVLKAKDRIFETKSTKGISFVGMPLAQQEGLMEFAKRLNKPEPIEDNHTLRQNLLTWMMSPDPETQAKFRGYDFSSAEALTNLSPATWEHLKTLQYQQWHGEMKATDALRVDQTAQNGMVNRAMVQANIDPSPPAPGTKGFSAEAAARTEGFLRYVENEKRRLETVTGKKASDEQLQAIVDRAVEIDRTEVVDNWFSNSTKTVYRYQVPGTVVEAKTLGEIPIPERVQATEWLRARGEPVNEGNIITVYNLLAKRKR